MAPLLALVGLRWAAVAAALVHGRRRLAVPWAPDRPVVVARRRLAGAVQPGRADRRSRGAAPGCCCAACAPGSYPRGGSVHLRLWAAERLAELPARPNLAGAPWITYYARLLGARSARASTCTPLPPVTGLLTVGPGRVGRARGRPGRLLARRRRAARRPGPDRRRGHASGRAARCCPVPGSGRAPRSPPGRRCAARCRPGSAGPARPRGAPAGGAALARDPAGPRSRRWVARLRRHRDAARAAARRRRASPALVDRRAPGPSARRRPADATLGALLAGRAARRSRTWSPTRCSSLGAVRLLGIGMREGYHPVHSRIGWQVWATERLMDEARTCLFPLYASLLTPAWLRLLGAQVGRGVEASTVLLLPPMTTVGDGAFLADDTMVGTYELGGGWLRIAPRAVGKRAFLGNSGMTAPGRAVPKDGLVAVLSATPRKAKKGTSWLGSPPMLLRRAASGGDTSRTFAPAAPAQGRARRGRAVPAGAGDVLRRARRRRGRRPARRLGAAAGLVAAAACSAGRWCSPPGVVAALRDDGGEVGCWSGGSAPSSTRCGARSCGATSWPTRSSRCSPRRGSSGRPPARRCSPCGCGRWARDRARGVVRDLLAARGRPGPPGRRRDRQPRVRRADPPVP